MIQNLQVTASDGRCHDTHFRQELLKSLHETLRGQTDAIKEAIERDICVSSTEAIAEVALTLSIVKEHYASLNPTDDLKAEYRVANSEDAPDRREPWGIVYVEPDLRHTPFFSVVAPVSAALAAGNCVALKVCT